jgi:hypothetical protein
MINSKHEIRNPKWFDQLTILSAVEGQFQNSNFLKMGLEF